MAFYFMLFLVFALSGLVPEMERALYALAGVYGLAFFSLVAGYFWARWYTVGVGLFGLITTVVGLWQTDPELRPLILNQMLFFGGTHLATSLMLWGDAMSKSYDGQAAWRERYHMDDGAVQRLGRAVIRAGVSLILAKGPSCTIGPTRGSSTSTMWPLIRNCSCWSASCVVCMISPAQSGFCR